MYLGFLKKINRGLGEKVEMGDRAGLLKVKEQLVAVTTKGESLEERLATTKATLEYLQVRNNLLAPIKQHINT